MLLDNNEYNKKKSHQYIPKHKVSDNKKGEILEVIKASQAAKKGSTTTNEADLIKEIEKYKSLYKNIKKELNEKDEKLQKEFQKKQEYLKKEIIELKKTNDLLVEKQNKSLLEIKNKEVEIANLNFRVECLNGFKDDLREEKQRTFSQQNLIETELKRLNGFESVLTKLISNVNDIKSLNGNLKIDNLKKEVNLLKREKWLLVEENKTLFYETCFLDIENNLLKKKYKIDFEDIFSYLTKNINEKNWSEFSESLSLYNLYINFKKNAVTKLDTTQDIDNSLTRLFGYIKEDKKVFVSITGDEYVIEDTLPKASIVDNAPSRATVLQNDENKVVVDHIYEDEDLYKTEMQLVLDFNKGIIKEKQQKVYQHLGEERITFVTYLNGNRIKDKISKYGFDTNWINPSEESLEMIKNKLQHSDLIVIYPNYCSHEIVYNFDNNEYNVLYTNSFNEDLLLKDVVNKLHEIRQINLSDTCH